MDHDAAQLGAAPELGEDLAGVQQMVRIERTLQAHLLVEVDLGELHAHQVALLDADAMLAGQHATHPHAEAQDVGAEFLGAVQLVGVVGIEQDQRMEIAVAGMEDVATRRRCIFDISRISASTSTRRPRGTEPSRHM